MPVPTFNGLPPFADFEAMKRKINDLVREFTNLLVNLDSLNVVSLTADHVDTGTLNAKKVTIRSDLSGGAYIQIDGNGIIIYDGTGNTFVVDINGNVTLNGTIIAANGAIGGWSISANAIMDAAGVVGLSSLVTGANDLRIWAGNVVPGSAAFRVYEDGTMYATNGNFTGTITGSNIYGSYIATANGTFPRIELSNTVNLLRAYKTLTNFLEIDADSTDPGIFFNNGVVSSGILNFSLFGDVFAVSTNKDILLDAEFGAAIVATASGTIPDLVAAINGKANAFSGVNGTVYVSSTLGGAADKAVTFTNGIATSIV